MRSRIVYFVSIVMLVVLGLLSRSPSLPAFLLAHAGDAIWALTVYIGFAYLVPSAKPVLIAACAMTFSVLIECSQLIDSAAFDVLRDNPIGRLIFGRGFIWIDMVRYAVGVLIGLAMDSVYIKSRCRSQFG